MEALVLEAGKLFAGKFAAEAFKTALRSAGFGAAADPRLCKEGLVAAMNLVNGDSMLAPILPVLHPPGRLTKTATELLKQSSGLTIVVEDSGYGKTSTMSNVSSRVNGVKVVGLRGKSGPIYSEILKRISPNEPFERDPRDVVLSMFSLYPAVLAARNLQSGYFDSHGVRKLLMPKPVLVLDDIDAYGGGTAQLKLFYGDMLDVCHQRACGLVVLMSSEDSFLSETRQYSGMSTRLHEYSLPKTAPMDLRDFIVGTKVVSSAVADKILGITGVHVGHINALVKATKNGGNDLADADIKAAFAGLGAVSSLIKTTSSLQAQQLLNELYKSAHATIEVPILDDDRNRMCTELVTANKLRYIVSRLREDNVAVNVYGWHAPALKYCWYVLNAHKLQWVPHPLGEVCLPQLSLEPVIPECLSAD
eukprot:TRINITY_DN4190_c0_g2_i1.p1 TRINITY_DN4190_c0_g2~~TRINITY_DN4190_c0_g2_i1.p1  ORF type:complete len:420 (-),score=62.69 TRINITY_DN4190_c0_g2_i1:600-1859(-)